ncbi:hypothetical protein [Nitratireductor sp. ZSWI3]|uniref:hypothetical protein n=1 Tax=Nitratireductor sp. ZSWI3 TaxID=2966359 RepID=UPI00214F6E74|nr:hypothetical protein [Nitratireductor sp. ZSWI3]MCR4266833.1 hypothetical protein [Nitratireductor sp. ZSWI3]
MKVNRNVLPPRLSAGLRHYISKGPTTVPVALSDLMARVRYIMPELQIEDGELEDLLAKEIMECSKRPILFDGRCRLRIG